MGRQNTPEPKLMTERERASLLERARTMDLAEVYRAMANQDWPAATPYGREPRIVPATTSYELRMLLVDRLYRECGGRLEIETSCAGASIRSAIVVRSDGMRLWTEMGGAT